MIARLIFYFYIRDILMKTVSHILLSVVIGGAMMMSFVSNATEGPKVTFDTILKTSQSWDGESYKTYLTGSSERFPVHLHPPCAGEWFVVLDFENIRPEKQLHSIHVIPA
jgi:hypothetical protein